MPQEYVPEYLVYVTKNPVPYSKQTTLQYVIYVPAWRASEAVFLEACVSARGGVF